MKLPIELWQLLAILAFFVLVFALRRLSPPGQVTQIEVCVDGKKIELDGKIHYTDMGAHFCAASGEVYISRDGGWTWVYWGRSNELVN